MTLAIITGGVILIVSCVAFIGLIALKMLSLSLRVSQQFVDAHKATLETLERTHNRNVKQNDGVLDRFMALDFSIFKAYQSAEGAEIGGFEEPDDGEEGSLRTYSDVGTFREHGADLERRLREATEEAAILAEDFGEDFDRSEGLRA